MGFAARFMRGQADSCTGKHGAGRVIEPNRLPGACEFEKWTAACPPQVHFKTAPVLALLASAVYLARYPV